MEIIDPRKTPFVPVRSRGELPHLYKPGATYFVTFRLADAVMHTRPRPRSDERLTPEQLAELFEPVITLGGCALKNPAVAKLVEDALLFFNHERYELLAWCIMPNHVHVVVAPFAGHPLETILHSWKSFTGRKAMKLLGKEGSFWERESFDHLVRSADDAERFCKYVVENPVKARLCEKPEQWEFSSAYRLLG